MRIVTVTNQGQITLLQGELEAVGAAPGDEFIISIENCIIVLTPKPADNILLILQAEASKTATSPCLQCATKPFPLISSRCILLPTL